MLQSENKILREGHNFVLEVIRRNELSLVNKKLVSSNETDKEMLVHEIKVLKSLSPHSCVPQLLQSSDSSYQREYIRGRELHSFIGKLDWEPLLDFTIQILRFLSFSHQNQIILADVKAENFLVTQDNRIVFIDYSLTQFFDQNHPFSGGSLSYMAPELFYGGSPTPQTDFYALGVALYELTTGQLPFSGNDINDLAKSHWFEEARDPTANTNLPREWGCLILRLMHKKASERFLDANDIIDFINLHFHKNFEREPETVQIKKLIQGKSEWMNYQTQAQTTVDAILKIKEKTQSQCELATRLLYNMGKYKEMDQLLPLLSEKSRIHFESVRALKCGDLDTAQQRAHELIKLGDIKAHNTLGTCSYYQKDLKSAENHYHQLLSYYQKEELYGDMIPILNNLANIKVAKNEFSPAEENYKKSQAMAEIIGNPKMEATALASQGYLYHRQNKWGLAISRYEKAAKIYDWLGLIALKMTNLVNLANLFVVIGFDEKASKVIGMIETFAGRENNDYLKGHCHILRGDLNRKNKKYDAAIEEYQQAISIFHQTKNISDKETATINLARTHIECGRETNAIGDDLGTKGLEKLSFFKDLDQLRRGENNGEVLKKLENKSEDRKIRLDGEEKLILLSVLSGYCHTNKFFRRAQKYKKEFIKLRENLSEGMDSVLIEKLNQTYQIWQDEDHDSKFSKALIELSTQLIAEHNANDLLKNILDKLIEYTHSERGFILIKKSQNINRIAISRHFDKTDIEEEERQISWSIATKVIDSAKPMITLDAPHDQRLEMTDSIHALKLKTIICLPFVFRGNCKC